jgi:hypothetical protein
LADREKVVKGRQTSFLTAMKKMMMMMMMTMQAKK